MFFFFLQSEVKSVYTAQNLMIEVPFQCTLLKIQCYATLYFLIHFISEANFVLFPPTLLLIQYNQVPSSI